MVSFMGSRRCALFAVLSVVATALAVTIPTADALLMVPRTTTTTPKSVFHQSVRSSRGSNDPLVLFAEEWSAFSSSSDDASSSSSTSGSELLEGVVLHESLSIRDPTPDERGKGGVEVAPEAKTIRALEVLAKIPKSLVISSVDTPLRAVEASSNARNFTWATDLTAATLVAMHPTEDELANDDAAKAKQDWILSWNTGGWATNGEDLGPPDANFGAKDAMGSLLSTGTDNDHNIYAKFRMPCHPVLLRASIGLAVLTGCTEDDARNALYARGFVYRSMRDALEPLVLEASPRPKGSKREKRCWDVADTLNKVLARATTLGDDTPTAVIVPIHDRLEHSLMANSKLVDNGKNEVLLVATRDIQGGEPISRDYESSTPTLSNDDSEGALRLLLRFGLPPKSWPVHSNEITEPKK